MKNIDVIWIAGAGGRVGTALNSLLDRREVEILNTDRDDVDIGKSAEVLRYADRTRPDAIINCAALTDVRACEQNPEDAYRVNALGARNLAIAARKIGARLVHISTDDVFGGPGGTPYLEFDAPAPDTVYGKSKLAGEQAVREFAPKHFILRSSWLYGWTGGALTDLLARTVSGEPIRVPTDQIGCPTSTAELARLILRLVETEEYGLYHACCEGYCSRLAFAQEALRLTGREARLVPVSSGEGEPELRPRYAVLDNFMLRLSGVYQMPGWREALAEFLREGRERV